MKARWPQPDFLERAPTRPAIAWLWSGASIAVAALSLGDWTAARQDLDRQRQRVALAQQHLQQTAPRPHAPASSASGASVSEAEARSGAQAVVDRIGHPWGQILANVEAETPDGLQWLDFTHDVDDAGVRLDGAAPDLRSVMQFVDNLSDRSGWSDVVVGRLRTDEARPAAGPPWHFELRAAIDARRIGGARRQGDR